MKWCDRPVVLVIVICSIVFSACFSIRSTGGIGAPYAKSAPVRMSENILPYYFRIGDSIGFSAGETGLLGRSYRWLRDKFDIVTDSRKHYSHKRGLRRFRAISSGGCVSPLEQLPAHNRCSVGNGDAFQNRFPPIHGLILGATHRHYVGWFNMRFGRPLPLSGIVFVIGSVLWGYGCIVLLPWSVG